jgi:hypothetical protein
MTAFNAESDRRLPSVGCGTRMQVPADRRDVKISKCGMRMLFSAQIPL